MKADHPDHIRMFTGGSAAAKLVAAPTHGTAKLAARMNMAPEPTSAGRQADFRH
ncbi:hypothetical protein GCM10028812_49090 [Ancylobacter sonchi]